MPKIIIHAANLDKESIEVICTSIPCELVRREGFYTAEHRDSVSQETLAGLREQLKVDINSVPANFESQQTRLLITDMDSTLISIECVDEIADYLSIKDKVSEITESAMRGEIDFNTSLKKRVKLLQGLDYGVLEKVYQERLTLNPGAENLVSGLQDKNIKTALVSGGFTFFTDRLKERLGLDFTLSNTLEVNDNKLTGEVVGEVVNGEVKATYLKQIANELNIDLNQAIAVGDGANDLPMLGLAGLGVAYRAKPVVQQQADVILNYAGLDAILHFLDNGIAA